MILIIIIIIIIIITLDFRGMGLLAVEVLEIMLASITEMLKKINNYFNSGANLDRKAPSRGLCAYL
jgi:hypothetical protein